jgi:hypothetical protein
MSKNVFAQQATVNGQLGVLYVDSDAKEMFRVGGQKAFRNNNPGNVGYSSYMKQLGAIGVDADGKSIFPDWETGDKAMKSLLKKGNAYVGKDIRGAIEAFAPPKYNPTEAYIKYVTEKSGLPENKKIGDMTDAEFQRVTDAMKEVEDSTPGYDLVNFGTVANPDWQKIGYMKIGQDGSSKDFSHYGPMIMQKHRGMIEYHLVPVPGASSDHSHSGKAHSADGGGGDHGTLERRGENVYRMDPDGKRRGFFHSA